MNASLVAGLMVLAVFAGAGAMAVLLVLWPDHNRDRAVRRRPGIYDSGSGPVPAAGPEPAPEAGYERPWLQRAPAPETDQSWRGDGWEQPELLTAPPAGDWRHPQWRDMPAARIPGYLG